MADVIPGRAELREEILGEQRLLKLLIGDLEVLETKVPRGAYALYHGFFSKHEEATPTLQEVRAVLACALAGGGMLMPAAEKLAKDCQADHAYRAFILAHSALGVAVAPNFGEEKDDRKKTNPETVSSPEGSDSGE